MISVCCPASLKYCCWIGGLLTVDPATSPEMIPTRIPTTKSHAPIVTTIITTFIRLPHVSTRASSINSIPNMKIRAPTTMTGMNPMITGPTTRTPAVAKASNTPARREFPPLSMNSRLLV